MEQKFDTEAIRLVILFENLTGTSVKDCIVDDLTDTVCFIVGEGKIGMAIGKNGNKVKNVEKLIKKNVKIFEFSKNLDIFIKKMIPKVADIKIRDEDGKKIVELRVDKKNRALIIGRDGKRLKVYKKILQRNHNIDDLIIR
jgi:N utilization substance protein A